MNLALQQFVMKFPATALLWTAKSYDEYYRQFSASNPWRLAGYTSRIFPDVRSILCGFTILEITDAYPDVLIYNQP